MIVRVTPAAKKDISAAYQWYESQKEGLGLEFIKQVDQAIEKIGLNPLGYAKVIRENRRCNLEQFPYALFFKVENEAIVVACLHSRRNPQLVKEVVRGVRPISEGPK